SLGVGINDYFRFRFLTPRCVAAVAVSVEAHYRDSERVTQPLFSIFFFRFAYFSTLTFEFIVQATLFSEQ
ncbi:hypothetical protein, partial [Dickeya oryzae]